MKIIPKFPNYSITKDGRVWSKERKDTIGRPVKGKWLVQSGNRYLLVSLFKNSKQYICCVHRLVLETYVGECPENMECRHLDGNLYNNKLKNLKWGTKSENSLDAVKHGTHGGFSNKGENQRQAKLTEEDVKLIIDTYYDGAYTLTELANHFSVVPSAIWRILNKRTWKHVWR